MRRTLLTAAAVLLIAGRLPAEVKTSEVTLKSGDEEIKAFVATPEGKGPFPGIVVIQEWWGLSEFIKGNARHLASKGFVAIAPDLYRGKTTDDPKVAGELRKGLPKDRALRDLKAAVDFLATHESVNKEKLGSIGWCMGGQYSLQLSLVEPRIAACVICYGALVTKADDAKPLNATVLGIFGETDMGIPPKQVQEFEAALKEAGKKVEELKIYPGTGHGFMRPKNGFPATAKDNPTYKEENAKDAWTKIDAFFAKVLGGK